MNNMRHHAYINSGIVTNIKEISDSDWYHDINNNQYIIEVEDTYPRPLTGWTYTFQGFAPPENLNTEESLLIQQNTQRLWGLKSAAMLTDKIGARNLLLYSQGNGVDISALLQSLGVAKQLMETGALKTARGFIASIKASSPLHENILQIAIDDITGFLLQMGYE